MSQDDKIFSSLTFPTRPVPDAKKMQYLVFKNATESVAVEAESADQACKQAGVESPYRILREEALRQVLLERNMFE